jgi:hypothetical protein
MLSSIDQKTANRRNSKQGVTILLFGLLCVLASLRLCVQICGTVCLAASLMLPARNESRKDAKMQGRQEEKTAEKKRFLVLKKGIEQKITNETKGEQDG